MVGKKLANIISYVLHPFLMPTYFFVVLMYFAPNTLRPLSNDLYLHVLALITITSFFIPALLMSSLRFTSIISSFTLDNKRERIIPFMFIVIIYGVSAYLFYDKFYLSRILFVSYFTITTLSVLLGLITYYLKISIHSAAVWSTFGFLYALQLKNPDLDLIYVSAACAFISGWVMSARLSLNAHNSPQVFLGGLTGFICGFGCFYFML